VGNKDSKSVYFELGFETSSPGEDSGMEKGGDFLNLTM
jgi:hypothetical protein